MRAAEGHRSMLRACDEEPSDKEFLRLMLKKDDALLIRNHALKAIEELMALVYISKDKCSDEQHEQIHRGVGLSIGKIQMEILEVINVAYPELDDLVEPSEGGSLIG